MEYNNTDIISEVPTGNPGTSSGFTELRTKNDFHHQNLTSTDETVPPKAGNEVVTERPTSQPELTCLTCCCLYGRDETLSHSASPSQEQYAAAASKALRQFLSSVAVYCYVLILTFCIVLLLLAELLIALNIIVVPDDELTTSENISLSSESRVQSRQDHVLYIIHWTNFSLLCLCLFELLLRVFAWRLDIVRSLVAVWDSAAVIVSFVVNIVTTLAAGYNSPFNSISLLIIFRFVHISSLIDAFVRRVKREYQGKLNKSESNAAHMQVASQHLHRQISEKDYEIKQLRAHLGKLDAEACDNLIEGLNKMKKKDDYDVELEQAIALSKREYDEANGGYDNPNFSRTPKIDNVFVPDIMIHHRENSIRRDKGASPSTSGTQPSSSGDTGAKSSKENTGMDLSHGELHSGADVDSHNAAVDTTLLLGGGQRAESDHWTVGYCIVQNPNPVLSSKQSLPEKGEMVKSDKMDALSNQTDEGIGEEVSSPARGGFLKIHSRSQSAIISSGTEDTLSDQGCVSATSLCSESGYQSDDKCISAPSASTDPPQPEEEDCASIRTILSNRGTSSRRTSQVTEINMVELNEKNIEEQNDDKDEDVL